MKRTSKIVFLLLGCAAFSASGCSISKSTRPDKRYDVNWHLGETMIDSIFGSDDDLWEKGYGFNNPNADRIRKELQ